MGINLSRGYISSRRRLRGECCLYRPVTKIDLSMCDLRMDFLTGGFALRAGYGKVLPLVRCLRRQVILGAAGNRREAQPILGLAAQTREQAMGRMLLLSYCYEDRLVNV